MGNCFAHWQMSIQCYLRLTMIVITIITLYDNLLEIYMAPMYRQRRKKHSAQVLCVIIVQLYSNINSTYIVWTCFVLFFVALVYLLLQIYCSTILLKSLFQLNGWGKNHHTPFFLPSSLKRPHLHFNHLFNQV